MQVTSQENRFYLIRVTQSRDMSGPVHEGHKTSIVGACRKKCVGACVELPSQGSWVLSIMHMHDLGTSTMCACITS